MDHDALKLLFQTAIGDYNGKQERLADTGMIALPDNFKLHDLEKYRDLRRRFRGHLQTNSLADLVQYTLRQAADPTAESDVQVFIDADKLAATAFYDLGTTAAPEHGEHTATLSLEATAPYAALLAIDGKRLDQRTLIDWIEDWAEYLSPYGADPGDPKPFSAALAAIREVKITQKRETDNNVGDFKQSRSVLEDVEASSKQGLPGGFLFRTEPYTGLPSREFRVRLALLSGDESKPLLSLRIIRLDLEKQEIAKDFKTELFRELDGKAVLTIGTFKA
ncbi:DUF2303 family protein [Luteimonas saliphila]|uniref:DUF2303 family protein n=1 Tax=Luteimonas saliphila TaxID=2804919 RepID=UPI00192DD27C|nr:DUF2303 family protein [Luteimonas saliphila]